MSEYFDESRRENRKGMDKWHIIALVGGGAIGALLGGFVGSTMGKTAGVKLGVEDGKIKVFADMGVSDDRQTLFNELKTVGYPDSSLTKLANATTWELQCLVGAHLIGQLYALPAV